MQEQTFRTETNGTEKWHGLLLVPLMSEATYAGYPPLLHGSLEKAEFELAGRLVFI